MEKPENKTFTITTDGGVDRNYPADPDVSDKFEQKLDTLKNTATSLLEQAKNITSSLEPFKNSSLVETLLKWQQDNSLIKAILCHGE